MLLISSSWVCARMCKCIQLKICDCYLLIRCRLSVVIPSSPFIVSVVVPVVFMFIIITLPPSLSGQCVKCPLPCRLYNFIQKMFIPVTCLINFSVILITVCSCSMARSWCLINRLVIPIWVLCISSSHCFLSSLCTWS